MGKGKDRFPWGEIKNTYVTGCIVVDGVPRQWTHSDLSKKYGVSTTSISKRSSQEKWHKERQEYQRKISEVARQHNLEARGGQLVHLDSTILTTLEGLARNIYNKVWTETMTTETETGVEEIVKKLNSLSTKEAKSLAEALKSVAYIRTNTFSNVDVDNDDNMPQLLANMQDMREEIARENEKNLKKQKENVVEFAKAVSS